MLKTRDVSPLQVVDRKFFLNERKVVKAGFDFPSGSLDSRQLLAFLIPAPHRCPFVDIVRREWVVERLEL